MSLYKWSCYDHIWPFFCHMYVYLSQNWGLDGHFKVLNRSEPWFIQNLWLKMQIFPYMFFGNIVEKKCIWVFWVLVFFPFCVIIIVPIMIQTSLGPQNVRLNLSFVKDFLIVGTKMARNGRKMAIYQMQILMINLWFSQDPTPPQGSFCVITLEPIKILTC